MKKLILIMIIGLALVGCASPGRMSLIDLDLRTAEQLKEARYETYALYGEPVPETKGDVQTKVFGWTQVLDFLNVIKGRIRIFSVEWRPTDAKK